MSLLLEHPEQWLSNNRNLGRAHHTWVAVGVTVAGTAVSVGGSMLSNAQANSKSNAALDSMPQFKEQPLVPYNPVQGSIDLNAMYPELAKFAQQTTNFRTSNRERLMPGSKNQFALASGVLQSWLKGEVPQDVVDFTNREVAQRTGGSFNPFTGGGRSQQAFARSIGALSSDFTTKGISAAPTWQQLANSFIVGPEQVAPLALEAANTRYRYDALNAGIQEANNSGVYTSGVNSALAQANQANLENAQQQQMWSNIGSGLSGVAAAYGGYRSPNSGSKVTPASGVGWTPKTSAPESTRNKYGW